MTGSPSPWTTHQVSLAHRRRAGVAGARPTGAWVTRITGRMYHRPHVRLWQTNTGDKTRGIIMRVAIIGAGPTGLFTAVALARRGHDVSVVDRDPGPNRNGWWPRAGVMQFHHPHAYRLQVIEALQTE